MRRRRSPADDAGFTLVELVVAIAIGAIVFTSLAALLGGSLKQMAVQKARTQANDIATQAMEDLQRLDDEYVGLCTAPPTPRPTGQPADGGGTVYTVLLPNCAGAPSTSNPCAGTPGEVPLTTYQCTRRGRTYAVTRDVAWSDPAARAEKLLGITVDWSDSVGSHTVTQRNLRPIVLGPEILSASVAPSPAGVDSSTGLLTQAVTFTAVTRRLTTTDAVRALFRYRDAAGLPRNYAVTLESPVAFGGPDDLQWTGTAPAGSLRLPEGTQYFTFAAVRASDRKEAAVLVGTANSFCSGSCPSSPSLVASTPAPVDIDVAGVLKANISLAVTTTGMTSSDVAFAVIRTVTGVRTIVLSPGTPCSTGSCTWSAVLTKEAAGSAGLRFPGGSHSVFFGGFQNSSGGRTATGVSGSVVFQ